MTELLAALLDAIMKAIPGVKGYRDRKRHAEIGASLLKFYNDANRMLIAGDILIKTSRAYERAAGDEDQASTLGELQEVILFYTREQAHALADIQDSFDRLQIYLAALIKNDSFRRLDMSFRSKSSTLQMLNHWMRLAYDRKLALDNLIVTARSDIRRYEWSFKLLPLTDDFGGQEHLTSVQAYLHHTIDPEANLARIAAVLEEVREAILANFKLEEVLLRVKDERLPRKLPPGV